LTDDGNVEISRDHPLQHGVGAAFAMFTQQRDELVRKAAGGSNTAALALDGPQNAPDAAAKADRLFEHCVEHRREVARRRIDDLQDLGGRRLLLQRHAGAIPGQGVSGVFTFGKMLRRDPRRADRP